MTSKPLDLSNITIVIEWENIRDVDSEWTDRGIRALVDELERESEAGTGQPTVLYLFDSEILNESSVLDSIERTSPQLFDLAIVRVISAPGLSYYQLKNRGVSLAETAYVILLDSDVCPEQGWLRGLLRPFSNPQIMAVAGVTALASHDLVSRTMALVWIFDLPSEHQKSVGKTNIHANNCAFRTAFFQQNPFPDSAAFKKQCGLWLADIVERGFGFERTAEARCRHAPHAGLSFVVWRGVQAGFDRDAKAKLQGKGRGARALYMIRIWLKKLWRSTYRILIHRREVKLPLYQLPMALLVAWLYFSSVAIAQSFSVLCDGVPNSLRLRWSESH